MTLLSKGRVIAMASIVIGASYWAGTASAGTPPTTESRYAARNKQHDKEVSTRVRTDGRTVYYGQDWVTGGSAKTKAEVVHASASGGGPKSKLHYLIFTGCHPVASQDGDPRQQCVKGQPGSLINGDECRLQDADLQTQDVFASTTGKKGTFNLVTHSCVDKNAGNPVPLADVIAAARTLVGQFTPPKPAFTVEPPNGRTLVNFRTLMSAGDEQPVVRHAFAVGLPTTITATPVSWSWIADDQIVATTDWPGRAYDGTDPKLAPADYYIWHSFDVHGPHTLGVRVTWQVRAELNGGVQLPVDRDVISESGPRPITALQARAQLFSGNAQ